MFWHPAAKLVEVLDVEAVEVIDCVIEFIFNEDNSGYFKGLNIGLKYLKNKCLQGILKKIFH